MQAIGFIGLGIMGRPMMLNLLRAKYPISAYTRRPVPSLEDTLTIYPSPEELAANTQIIITMLPTSADVEDIILGKKGLIHGAKPGTIVIDMSTISAAVTKRIAERLSTKQIDMLDAPVSGGEQGAIDGSLSIMVGGKAEVLQKVLPILTKLGKKIVHIGDHGAGQTTKACNQIIIAETIIAISEALSLAKAAGVDPAKVRDALLGGYANSRVLEIHGKRILDEDYQPGFKASLHRKDMHLALEQAHLLNLNLPAANHAMHCLDRLVLKGHGELDSTAMYLLVDE